jgi:hypothetical protein
MSRKKKKRPNQVNNFLLEIMAKTIVAEGIKLKRASPLRKSVSKRLAITIAKFKA